MRLTKSELILLKYLDGYSATDHIPNYFKTLHKLKPAECIQRFLDGGVLEYAPLDFILKRITIAQLKDPFSKTDIICKGKKQDYIDTALANFDSIWLRDNLPTTYVVNPSCMEQLDKLLYDDDYYERYDVGIQLERLCIIEELELVEDVYELTPDPSLPE